MGLQLRDLIEVPGGDHVSLHVRCAREADEPPATIEDLTRHLGLEGLDRQVCEMIFPVATRVIETELPAIEHLAAKSIAWNEELVTFKRFHFASLDKQAFLLAAQRTCNSGRSIEAAGHGGYALPCGAAFHSRKREDRTAWPSSSSASQAAGGDEELTGGHCKTFRSDAATR